MVDGITVYKQICDYSEDSIILFDKDMNFVYMNYAANRKIQIKEDSLIGKNIDDAITIDAKHRFNLKNSISKVLVNKTNYSYTDEMVVNNTIVIYKEMFLYPVFENDSIMGVCMVGRDVSNYVEKITEQQQNYNKILNLTPAIVYVYDLINDKNISINNETSKILNYTQDEIYAMGDKLFLNLIHPDDILSAIHQNESMLSSNEDDAVHILQFRMKVKDDGYRTFFTREVVFERDENNNPISKLGIAIDVTELKELEKNIKKSSEINSAILSTIDEGVLVLNRDLQIISINDWLLNTLGLNRDNALIKYVNDKIPHLVENGITEKITCALNGKIVVCDVKSLELKNGKKIYYIATIKPFKANGTIDGVIIVFKDVTIYRNVKVLAELSHELDILIVSQENIISKIK
jgi:PAS domain S-box-containing protein